MAKIERTKAGDQYFFGDIVACQQKKGKDKGAEDLPLFNQPKEDKEQTKINFEVKK